MRFRVNPSGRRAQPASVFEGLPEAAVRDVWIGHDQPVAYRRLTAPVRPPPLGNDHFLVKTTGSMATTTDLLLAGFLGSHARGRD